MNIKRTIIGAFTVTVLAFGVAIASAQADLPSRPERPGVNFLRESVNVISGAIGLEPREIAAQVREGATLAEIIAANGGDVQDIMDEILKTAMERIRVAVEDGTITQERAGAMLDNLQGAIERGLNGDFFGNRLERRELRLASERILMNVTAEETGLRPTQILRQLRDGSTLSEIITANGGSVEDAITAAVASAKERINEAVVNENMTQARADELLASLQTVYTEAFNGELGRPGIELLVGVGVVRLAAEETGLELRAIVEQMRAGKSLTDVLTENDIDISAFIETAVSAGQARLDQAVTNGRITQEQADKRIANLHQALTERLFPTGE